jgi:pimeloyl-ACP methyl ester carboxylesterase
MDVQKVEANGIEIAYETFGDPGHPPVLMVMGLGTQMIAWPDEMCTALADAGLYVVRFDNRDVGLSTHLRGVRAPAIKDLLLRREKPPYTISDMADDTIGLMDALGFDSVHLVGASMGGFISQTVAVRAPHRVRSLTLIMTSTGSRMVGQPKPALLTTVTRRRRPTNRDEAVDSVVATFRAIGSKGNLFDADFIREMANRSLDRAHDPGGYLRQLSAILAQPNRTDALRRIRVPALVIHGLHDPLVAPSGGLAAARLLRNAKFVGFSGMGHDLPRALWPQIVAEIVALIERSSGHRLSGPGVAESVRV